MRPSTADDRPAGPDDDLPDPALVDFPEPAADTKRTNIVGNPMFSNDDVEDLDEDEDEEDEGEEPRRREELLGLGNLNMDYDQIMEYFDNLKESNA